MLGLLQRLARAVMGRKEQPYAMPSSLSTVQVDRAIRELRAGLPVLLLRDGPSAGLLIQGGEFATPASRDWMKAQSGSAPELLLSHERGKTLGLHGKLGTDGADDPFWLEAAELNAADWLGLVDPLASRKDTAALAAKRHLPGQDHHLAESAVLLAKQSELLPSLAVAVMRFDSAEAGQRWLMESGVVPVQEQAVLDYDTQRALSLQPVSEAEVPLKGDIRSRLITFRPAAGGLEHLAIIIGEPEKQKQPVAIRLHSSCLTGDIFGSLRCDCGEQFRKAIEEIHAEGHGVVLYLNQEGRGIGIANKLKAYQLQDHGHDTFDSNEMLGYARDERRFCMAAQMLKHIGVTKVRLMTNNPAKVNGLKQFGIEVADRIAHVIAPNGVNDDYLKAKAEKGGHWL